MASIKIRFNTQFEKATSQDLKWRVLIDGEEHLARSITLRVPSHTTEDTLQTGAIKWHLSCFGEVIWDGEDATII